METSKNTPPTHPETNPLATPPATPSAEDKSAAPAPLITPPEPAAELSELKDLLQRTQANFENYRKQVEKRYEEMQQFAAKEILLQLLPIIDNFELALKSSCVNLEDFRKGMELIYAQLNTILEAEDVKPINTEKEKFNPYLHEALLKVESEQPQNIIIEEFQRGFTLHGQVLRPAKVKISAGNNLAKN